MKEMKKEKENFVKKFWYIMPVIIMAGIFLIGIFLTACGSRNEEREELGEAEIQAVPQTEMQSEILPAPQTEMQSEPDNNWAQAYLLLIEEIIQKLRADGYDKISKFHYSLIYLDDDDIPELAYGPDGYWISVYTWQDGQVYTVMDREPYGTWGRIYSYIPFQSIVSTECYSFGDTDNGSYIGRYWDFYEMMEITYELEYIYGLSWVETRENENDETATITYYYEEPDMTEREITKEEFDAYGVTDGELYHEDAEKYIFLIGRSSAYEIINELIQAGRQLSNDDKETEIAPSDITLSDITWDDYNSGNEWDTWLYFSFSDDTVVDIKLTYSPSIIQKVDFIDITGDGEEEVLIYRYFANTATEYTLINFFQIEENIVTEISPEAELEELAENVWNVIEEDFSGKEYDMPTLRLESYDKVSGLAYVANRALVGYQDGGWQILEWIDCPKPDLSGYSD